ncbi:MAG: hypothetical protein JJT77_04980 [Crocinitomicaceae bacterium]|nr:hypothetical protein [Crocinitomicaceae bacterium]
MSTNKVTEILVGVALIGLVISIIQLLFKLDKAADTKLYESDALDYLKDEGNRRKMDSYVEEYHKSGKWDETILNETES